ncbi:PAS domain-containing protein [Flavobacterium xinjiangense]|uniref:histidine kinase n=1 Tax=Flavobacterium xinjiangense TaxID=178356 RepID=A0A1M7PLJ2_9FLAO|nr:PAS domain-containing protein [Flavobacterium xinjiangense]SHN18073.1 PAS domain S-box-containing protein [Flavobacterium xinjiangense]
MKISFEKKIFLGFVINVLVVIASGWIFISRLSSKRDKSMDSRLNWIEIFLFFLSVVLLIVVYFIIRAQLQAKAISQNLLLENKQLLQSIIDNTTNPIFIKKINGEYLLINKQFESLFQISNEEIIGKTDEDFLPKNVADAYRDSDFEVVKALRELKTEETIQQPDGPHTYIAVKFPLFDSKGRVYAVGGISTDITDRKKLEESSKSADKFFNMSLDMLIIASADKFIKINPAVSKILGYSEDELLSQPFLSYVHPDDVEITKKEVEKLQTGMVSLKFENRYICKDRSFKWILWSVYPDVSTGLLYAVARDITDIKATENSIAEANKFFNMSYELFVVAKGDYFIKVNPAFTRILGFSQEEMNDKPFLSFSHPDDLKASTEAIEKLKNGGTMINYRARALCKDGSYKWLEWSSAIDVQTGMMYAVARDVTEKIQNEESLKISNMFFNMAFDILTVAKDEHFIKINQAFTKTLGYNQEDMDRLKFMDLIHPDDKATATEILSKHLKGEPVVNFRTRFLCKDGTYKWLDWNSNMDIQQGVFYSVGRDVTELVKLEEEEQTAIDELYENEEKLRLIVENIGEGVIVANADKKIVLANEMANEIFGIEEDEKISSHLTDHFELYFPDEKTIFPSQNLPMERALNGEITDDVEVVLWNPVAQQKKRVLISGRPLVDQNNKVVAAVVTIKDISKYKQLEQELKETELKYRQLIGFRKGGDTVI